MYKLMYLDDRNIEGDELVGYFESEEALINDLRARTQNNKNCRYDGIEMSAGKKCYIVSSVGFKNPTKSRYYLVKLENGWI